MSDCCKSELLRFSDEMNFRIFARVIKKRSKYVTLIYVWNVNTSNVIMLTRNKLYVSTLLGKLIIHCNVKNISIHISIYLCLHSYICVMYYIIEKYSNHNPLTIHFNRYTFLLLACLFLLFFSPLLARPSYKLLRRNPYAILGVHFHFQWYWTFWKCIEVLKSNLKKKTHFKI